MLDVIIGRHTWNCQIRVCIYCVCLGAHIHERTHQYTQHVGFGRCQPAGEMLQRKGEAPPAARSLSKQAETPDVATKRGYEHTQTLTTHTHNHWTQRGACTSVCVRVCVSVCVILCVCVHACVLFRVCWMLSDLVRSMIIFLAPETYSTQRSAVKIMRNTP